MWSLQLWFCPAQKWSTGWFGLIWILLVWPNKGAAGFSWHLCVRMTKFLAEMARMVKWAKNRERQNFPALRGKTLVLSRSTLAWFHSLTISSGCVVDWHQHLVSPRRGHQEAVREKQHLVYQFLFSIAWNIPAWCQEYAQVIIVCSNGRVPRWVSASPQVTVDYTSLRTREQGRTDRQTKGCSWHAWVGCVLGQDGSWVHHQPAALWNLSQDNLVMYRNLEWGGWLSNSKWELHSDWIFLLFL